MRRVVYAWMAGLIVVALGGAVLAARGHAAARDPGPPPSFTWDGRAWDCARVAAWDRREGPYEPDGAPVPYEVISGCSAP